MHLARANLQAGRIQHHYWMNYWEGLMQLTFLTIISCNKTFCLWHLALAFTRSKLSQHSSGGSTDKFCIFWLPILGSLVVMIVTRYKLALPLSGKKCSLNAPTVNCVMLLLTPVCLLIPDTSVRDLIAMIMTASSWSCWGLPQLKRPSINNIKRIWRLQFSFVNPGFWVVSDYLALIAI